MRKFLALLLACIMLMSLAACGEDKEAEPTGESVVTTDPTDPTDTTEEKLPFSAEFAGGIALAVSSRQSSGMTAERILNYCSYDIFHSYIFENWPAELSEHYKITVAQQDFYFNQYAVPEDVVFGIVESKFSVDDMIYDMLRASDRYDSATKTFLCTEPIWFTGIDSVVLAYEALAGNDYQLYVEARVNNHPYSGCSDCASNESCVIERIRFSVIVCAVPGHTPIVVSFQYTDTIPDSATKLG